MTAVTITYEQMNEEVALDLEQMNEEVAAQFPATQGWAKNGNYFIDTRITRDERRSNNGGEYSYWTEYWHDLASGRTYRQEKCSCDFWQPMEEPEYCAGLIDLPQ